MREYDDTWVVAKGQVVVDLVGVDWIKIAWSCTKPVQVQGVRGEEKIPLQTNPQGQLRAKAKGFRQVILKGTGETPFGYSLRVAEASKAKEVDHSDPPAIPLPQPSNLIQYLQQESRRMNQMFGRRLEPEQLPGASRYEIEDDDWAFEEELFASPKQTRDTDVAEKQTKEEKPAPAGDRPASKAEGAPGALPTDLAAE